MDSDEYDSSMSAADYDEDSDMGGFEEDGKHTGHGLDCRL